MSTSAYTNKSTSAAPYTGPPRIHRPKHGSSTRPDPVLIAWGRAEDAAFAVAASIQDAHAAPPGPPTPADRVFLHRHNGGVRWIAVFRPDHAPRNCRLTVTSLSGPDPTRPRSQSSVIEFTVRTIGGDFDISEPANNEDLTDQKDAFVAYGPTVTHLKEAHLKRVSDNLEIDILMTVDDPINLQFWCVLFDVIPATTSTYTLTAEDQVSTVKQRTGLTVT